MIPPEGRRTLLKRRLGTGTPPHGSGGADWTLSVHGIAAKERKSEANTANIFFCSKAKAWNTQLQQIHTLERGNNEYNKHAGGNQVVFGACTGRIPTHPSTSKPARANHKTGLGSRVFTI